MQQPDARVKILNEHGDVIGNKLRGDVDKRNDILHCADVFVFDAHDRLVLARIPDNTLHGGLLTSSAATMVREDEDPQDAARRALERELNMVNPDLHLLGEHFFSYDDGVKRLKTTYWSRAEEPLHPNPEDVADLVILTREEVDQALSQQPERFAPTFIELWKSYAKHDTPSMTR